MCDKEFYIGIDSDGTVFDSMTIKHKYAFIPRMLEVWKLNCESEKVFEVCERINLYSKTRGINRFDGLAVAFSELQESIDVPKFEDLSEFLSSDFQKSNDGLRRYLKEYDSRFLREVLEWSESADELFGRCMEEELPFEGVVSVIKKAKSRAYIGVISSASRSSLERDWQKGDLRLYTDIILGQENGSKANQLRTWAQGNKTLMIGDSLGDSSAAKEAGAWFYPIIPGKEVESWSRFLNKYLDIFLGNGFNAQLQGELDTELADVLK